jgi:hypothetical protein
MSSSPSLPYRRAFSRQRRKDQLRQILGEGDFLLSKPSPYGFTVHVYHLNGFYVELWRWTNSDSVFQILTFEGDSKLMCYLQEMKLPSNTND